MRSLKFPSRKIYLRLLKNPSSKSDKLVVSSVEENSFTSSPRSPRSPPERERRVWNGNVADEARRDAKLKKKIRRGVMINKAHAMRCGLISRNPGIANRHKRDVKRFRSKTSSHRDRSSVFSR